TRNHCGTCKRSLDVLQNAICSKVGLHVAHRWMASRTEATRPSNRLGVSTRERTMTRSIMHQSHALFLAVACLGCTAAAHADKVSITGDGFSFHIKEMGALNLPNFSSNTLTGQD